MKYQEAVAIKRRMCSENKTSCAGCPLFYVPNDQGLEMNCLEYEMYDPEEAEKVIARWAAENMGRRLIDIANQRFPQIQCLPDGTPVPCAAMLFGNSVRPKQCGVGVETCAACWKQLVPMEG